MKLFISWSGEFSGKVAECLSIWIPTIIQSVEVFYSPDDIAKGENWGNRLSEELEQTNFGIVCLTPENVLAPWIHFEAGALSKASNSRVSAIMLGVAPSDLKGPLARLQNTIFDRTDFYRLFQSINNSNDAPLEPSILKNAFDHSWVALKSDIDGIITNYSSCSHPLDPESRKRNEQGNDSDALEEILRIVRTFDSAQNPQFRHSIQNTALNFPPDLSPLSWSFKSGESNQCLVLVACPRHCIPNTTNVILEYMSVRAFGSALAVENDLERYGYHLISVSSTKIYSLFHELRKYGATMGLCPTL